MIRVRKLSCTNNFIAIDTAHIQILSRVLNFEMASDKLSFSLLEKPEWRDLESTTSEMITKITGFRLKYNKLPEQAKRFCTEQFAKAMAVDYIHNLNVGECVGTQDKENTKELLEKTFPASLPDDQDAKRSEKETMNTYRAMKEFHEKHTEMEHTGLLTVQEICDIHKVLLNGLHEDNGEIRTTDTYTHWANGVHFYPPPEIATQRFYALIDHHNMYMSVRQPDKDSEEYTGYIFKCAARLLFEFVDTHPFGDGNGRMCRLLANYVVGLITPFPVALYHTSNPRRSQRDDYVNAIVRCREHPEEGPQGLAAMLVEGAFRGWESLFKNLEGMQMLEPGIVIGPIVVKKSTCDTKDTYERVNRIWHSAQKMGVTVDKEQVIKSIVGATKETDVSALRCTQYMPISVSVTKDISVQVHVFGD